MDNDALKYNHLNLNEDYSNNLVENFSDDSNFIISDYESNLNKVSSDSVATAHDFILGDVSSFYLENISEISFVGVSSDQMIIYKI